MLKQDLLALICARVRSADWVERLLCQYCQYFEMRTFFSCTDVFLIGIDAIDLDPDAVTTLIAQDSHPLSLARVCKKAWICLNRFQGEAPNRIFQKYCYCACSSSYASDFGGMKLHRVFLLVVITPLHECVLYTCRDRCCLIALDST